VVITSALTCGLLYRDPAANPIEIADKEICAVYRVIYSQYRVEDSPSTVEELEQKIHTDFLEPIGALGIMVADSASKTV
jgi:hypothetical protein